MADNYTKPAYHQIIHQLIDWELIARRYEKYPAIRRAFNPDTLKDGCEKSPYYCHYMAWRLGTWEDESPFTRLEELLLFAETLPNWKHEKSLLRSTEFANFWSLVWQLQIAEYLDTIGSNVCWGKTGPDLSVVVNGERWYAECYTYRKSFDLFLFLEDLLKRIDSAIRISYDLCMPFQLPQKLKRAEFLDAIVSPFLNPRYLAKAKNAAAEKYPVILYQHPSSSLRVYVVGDNDDVYTPGIIANRVGDPENYLKVAMREALNAKWTSNSLSKFQPNIVVVNYLLSMDYQLGPTFPESIHNLINSGNETKINAMTVSTVGIDERISKRKLKVVYVSDINLNWLGKIANVSQCCAAKV